MPAGAGTPAGGCACGSGTSAADCCRRLHAGEPAADALALMRSRYVAWVLGDLAYLRRSWHPDTCPADLAVDPATRWLGLAVRAFRVVDADHAEVEFVARGRQHGRGFRLHERSRFVRLDGRWVYVDGDPVAATPGRVARARGR